MLNQCSQYLVRIFILISIILLTSCATHTNKLNIEKENVRFIVIGDWGDYGKKRQRQVADQLNEFASSNHIDFIVSTGDNFYDKGVQSNIDPLWQTSYESVYNLQHIKDLDWYIVLGNHDYQGNYQAQIKYGDTNSQWNLPETFHSLRVSFDNNENAVFLFTDTNAYQSYYHKFPDKYLNINDQNPDLQSRWIRKRLKKTHEDDWKIVIGHHPVYSAGHRGNSKTLINEFVPIFDHHNVHAYFAGHDHFLQHQKAPGKTHYFISGAGAKLRDAGEDENTRFSRKSLGFAYVIISNNKMLVSFVDEKGDVLYRTGLSQ